MINYVKFRRGTPEQYAALTNIDSDTLYFISEPKSATGALYLGTKLIAGGPESTISFSLSDLTDVQYLNLVQDKQFLVYDELLGKWTNATLDEIIVDFVGATQNSEGKAGLVPAPPQNVTNAFLKSDGTWAEIDNAVTNNVTTITNSTNQTHESIMEEVTSADPPAEQDILIIKDLIANDKYSHTAYVYNNNAWEAMDGNYNAKNVYFKNDFIFTEPVGTVSIPESGNQVVSAAGKNVEEFLAGVFAKEKNPTVTQPIVDIYSTAVSTSYEVGSTFTPGYTTRLDPGNYEFGPSTSVTIIKYDISDTLKNTSDKDSDTFNSVIVEDNFSYTVSGKITYSDGVIPNTNLGNPYTEGQIKSKTLEPSSTTVVSHRNTFYGTLEVKNDFASIDSTTIRNLKSSKKGYKNGSTFDITIPVGAMRVIIAYPSDLRDLTSVLDVNALRAEIVSSFKQIENGVAVKGYNNYEAKNYKVYILDYAFPTSTQNIYKVTI